MSSRPWQLLTQPGAIGAVTGLSDSGNPFLRPAFLSALETSGAVGTGTAWQPAHLLFTQERRPAALLPLYLKYDSRGEYVFDHAWANAYLRHGLSYYPKLVTAIPFTPVPGPRLLLAPGASPQEWIPHVLEAVKEQVLQAGASGWHGLFVGDDWLAPGKQSGMVCRDGCRFHWTNPGYRDFADFLDTLTSKKRKDIRRERRRLEEQGVSYRTITGHEIGQADWRFFYDCYERTYLEHGQQPYLRPAFFHALADSMPASLSLVIAEDREGPMASALFLHSATTLYGRYWGSMRRADGLHFEVCYYQGMEICLRMGLTDFDPGTQGEHKLLRGFAPVVTRSLHWLGEPAFQAAIGRFADEERREVGNYIRAAAAALPYREASATSNRERGQKE
ncbi:MAG: N-acetyltransferase [Moraxellaceae bacterium]|jgi:predicted N-acyltransferase|nr:N-acetyltransferase [Moraxellaceae bacterium]